MQNLKFIEIFLEMLSVHLSANVEIIIYQLSFYI